MLNDVFNGTYQPQWKPHSDNNHYFAFSSAWSRDLPGTEFLLQICGWWIVHTIRALFFSLPWNDKTKSHQSIISLGQPVHISISLSEPEITFWIQHCPLAPENRCRGISDKLFLKSPRLGWDDLEPSIKSVIACGSTWDLTHLLSFRTKNVCDDSVPRAIVCNDRDVSEWF